MALAPTPNLRLNVVQTDIRNWHDRVNDNFRILDAAIGTYLALSNLQGVWENSTAYTVGQAVVDDVSGVIYSCLTAHTSAASPTTFAQDRAVHATYWTGYNVPAQSRGTWLPGTAYSVNNFVYADNKYAIALDSHTSGSTFAADVTANHWGILVDGTIFGAQVLPTPTVPDANKLIGVDGSGIGYVLKQATDIFAFLSASGLGQSIFQAANAAAVRALIDVPQTASVQPIDSTLTAIAALATDGVVSLTSSGTAAAILAVGVTGQSVLAASTAALARSAIGAVGDVVTATHSMSGAAFNEAKWTDIASATTTDLGAANGNYGDVTGTTTITGLGTIQAGTRRTARFTGVLTLQYNGTSLILPGGSITTVAGDIAEFVSLGSGNWLCIDYRRPAFYLGWQVLASQAPSATPNFTWDNIPSWVNFLRITGDLFPASDGVAMNFLVRKASGTDIANYDSQFLLGNSAAASASVATAQAVMNLFGSVQSDANVGGINFSIDIANIQSSRHKRVLTRAFARDSGATYNTFASSYLVADTAVLTGVKLIFSGGNIANGRVLVEGCA